MMLDDSILWIIAGLVLIVGEMLTTGFFLLFLALGCLAASLTGGFGFSHLAQGSTFAFVSVFGVLALRRPIQKRLLKTISINADIGKQMQIDQTIPPHQQLRITYQGSSWMATNLDADEIHQGDRVVIVGIDGNTLLIRKVH